MFHVYAFSKYVKNCRLKTNFNIIIYDREKDSFFFLFFFLYTVNNVLFICLYIMYEKEEKRDLHLYIIFLIFLCDFKCVCIHIIKFLFERVKRLHVELGDSKIARATLPVAACTSCFPLNRRK